MLFSSIKEINLLISKGILNIHLKVTIEKNWRSQNFDFVSWKKSFPGQFWRTTTHTDIIELENLRSGSKTVCAFSTILILKGILMFSSERVRGFWLYVIIMSRTSLRIECS